MNTRKKKYLNDILGFIETINSFMTGITTFAQYDADAKTQSAVEFQLLKICDTTELLLKEYPTVHINNSAAILSFGRLLRHAYHSIDNSIVWAILQHNLPELKVEIENLLD